MTFSELFFPKFIFIVYRYFEHLDFDPVTEMSTVRINPDPQACFRQVVPKKYILLLGAARVHNLVGDKIEID